ncbi:MAG: NAD(P)-dependent oxidoreductase [Ginsengibacter sp.]
MKMFITGITGFVGGAVANYFCNLGYDVSGIGRKPALPSHISKKCNYTQADICKPLDPIEADIIIHAAALASDTASFKEVYKVNVQGTQNVLQAAKAGHIVYISSSSVYHYLEHSMKETEAGQDYEKLSDYGKSKFLAEQLITKEPGRNKKTILRPRAIYGKYDQVLLPRLLKLVKGNNLLLPQHLSNKISLTHIDNIIHAVELCINNQTGCLEIFNVADKEVYDLHQILTTLLPLVVGKKLKEITIRASMFNLFVAINTKVKFNRSFNRFAASSLINTAVLNIDAITQQMNYDPLKNFNNSYAEIINWIHKEDGWKNFFNPNLYLKSMT